MYTHRLMISLYTFFSAPFFLFISCFFFLCLPPSVLVSLFHPSTLLLALLFGSSWKRLDGCVKGEKTTRNLKRLAKLCACQFCLASSQYCFSHVGCWIITQLSMSAYIVIANNLCVCVCACVWRDFQNLTAGVKVALLLHVRSLYSAPDWRHFQWC